MKRNTIVLLTVLMLSLALVFTGCGSTDAELQQQVAALQQENQQLRDQIAVLTEQLSALQTASLENWTMEAVPSEDRSTATIHFTATPLTPVEGMTVTLVVSINDFVAETVDCQLEGDVYTATVELPAMDGYSYSCLLSGNPEPISLASPGTGSHQELVNLGSAMNAYCNLFVENWTNDNSKLTVSMAYVTAQMPSLSSGGSSVTATGASLVFLHNGEEIARQAVTLTAGEGEGTYEATLTDVTFDLPQLADDHQLDLVLEVELSSGDAIEYSGCSWFIADGVLNPVMG